MNCNNNRAPIPTRQTVFQNDIKLKQKTLLYHIRSDIKAKDNKIYDKKYFIELICQGDKSKTLVEVFRLYSNSIFETPNIQNSNAQTIAIRNYEFNILFIFAVEMYFLHSKVIRNQNRSQLPYYIQDFYTKSFGEKELRNRKTYGQIINLLVKQCRSKIDNMNLGDWSMQKIHEVYVSLKQQKVAQIMAKPATKKKCYFPENYEQGQELQRIYLDKTLTQIFRLQFTKKKLKQQKYDSFFNKYKKYLKIEPHKPKSSYKLLRQKVNQQKGNFYMKRYTNTQKDEILINMQDLIKMNQHTMKQNSSGSQKDYQNILFQISKAIIKELQDHHTMTNRYYPFLTPECVLFNQLSLKINLNYQNILREALGLLFKPMSVEQLITLHPTPEGYDDSFKAPLQYNIQNEMKMKHFLFGLATENQNQEQNIREKEQLMKQSEGWRCLLTISFIMNGREWKEEQSEGQFVKVEKQRLAKQLQNKLMKDPLYYKKVLGQGFTDLLQYFNEYPQYDPTEGISFFNQFVLKQNDYSIIMNNQFHETQNRLRLQKEISLEFTSIIDQRSTFFKTITNPFKYLLRFYLSIYLKFSYLLLLKRYFQAQKFLQGLNFYEKVKQLNNNAEKIAKKAQRKLSAYPNEKLTSIKASYGNFIDMMKIYNEVCDCISNKCIELNGRIGLKRVFIQFRQLICSTGEYIEVEMPKIRAAVLKILEQTFLAQLVPSQSQIEIQSVKKRYTKIKLRVMALATLYINQSSSSMIQSMIAPKLLQSQEEIQKQPLEKRISQYNKQIEVLQYCQQMIKEFLSD